jgi:dihydroorotate dehydrogenase (NAD+) catalytic subunit
MAGASVVGVGSAVYYRGVAAMREIGEELVALMSQNGWASVEIIRGKSHQREEKETL